MNKNFIITALMFFLFIQTSFPQDVSWKREEPQNKTALQLFHATHVVNLPTTETLQKGDLEFEIAHRFLPYIKEGSKALFGLDGPANIKFGLSYGITNFTILGISRSSLNDNYELIVKQRLVPLDNNFLPAVLAVRAGAAWNNDTPGRSYKHNRNFQYYGQLIINALYGKRFGIGLVPTYVYNSYIFSPERENSFTLGMYAQVYLTRMFSIMGEFNPVLDGLKEGHNSGAIGFELETGGHFFKIFMTNNEKLNTSQSAAGAIGSIDKGGEWRIGFNITRVLKF
ncbi:MAG TPA: DUF5777 family beta-barrel protein [Ignavibacteriales bacterium]|nr:DUF5777 family beta-barrel protein [Ignavibacteriales bacterium]